MLSPSSNIAILPLVAPTLELGRRREQWRTSTPGGKRAHDCAHASWPLLARGRYKSRYPDEPISSLPVLQNVRTRGEAALQDGRHGHPTKLREIVRQWLERTCREAPHTPSHVVQAALQERFGILVSIGHLKSGACQTGGRQADCSPGKKLQFPCSSEEPHWQEGAGGLLLVAAAEATGGHNIFPCSFPGFDTSALSDKAERCRQQCC